MLALSLALFGSMWLYVDLFAGFVGLNFGFVCCLAEYLASFGFVCCCSGP